ncbi:hypothetical protein [Pedobacter miscanthi]|jgi:hypothetical protein|uniref:hypothetical protein n=1 Tax=Pedobacter miscanthi TaxID=2259170 RepID=UPI002930ED74|nr:hypothetical protein [Pedobacter miscanthi]
MKKYSFSNEGFQSLQKQLYRLPDSLLKIQANFVSTNFKKWVTDNFVLNNSQLNCIDIQDLKMIRFLGSQVNIAIINRLPITLIKPIKPINQALSSKLIRLENNFTALFEINDKIKIGGQLTIYITYCTKHDANAYQKYNQQYLNQLF